MLNKIFTRYSINLYVLLIILIFIPSITHAVPRTINYQGYLTNTNGAPLNGSVNIVFSIYAANEGGTALWTETHNNVLVSNGIFSVIIGNSTPIEPSYLDNDRYLGVKVGKDAEMSPRQKLTSVAYAIQAKTVENLQIDGSNAFLGDSSGNSNTTGYMNTFLGNYSGQSNTIGHHNTFVGHSSGSSNTIGEENTFIGLFTGSNNTTGNRNTFLGSYSGASNTTGYDNVFIGNMSGRYNTTGFYNTFMGNFSGRYNTTGIDNTFLGYYSGYYNTSGSYNTFQGYYSGYSNTMGYDNTFLGYNSGNSNTVGAGNTFIGSASGYSTTTGSANTFIGPSSGYSNTTGRSNVFLGLNTGNNNTTGNDNTFIGYFSGTSNTTGSSNTYLGYQSGYNNETGLGNVFLGYRVGYNETGSNKLYIDNSNTSSPLVYGEFDNNILRINGRLDVNGAIYQRGSSLHADYVFDASYNIESIDEHTEFMWNEKHLKAVPKANQNDEGQDVVEIGTHIKGMLEELEKAHVYISQLNELIKTQQETITELKEKVSNLERTIK